MNITGSQFVLPAAALYAPCALASSSSGADQLMRIFVQTLTGKTISLNVEPTTKVGPVPWMS